MSNYKFERANNFQQHIIQSDKISKMHNGMVVSDSY